MFHFPAFPPHPLYIQGWVTPHNWCWVSPFGHPRITARLTAPRGLSQPPTSFIGPWCQGIHRTPFNTYQHTPPTTPTNPKAGTVIESVLLKQENLESLTGPGFIKIAEQTKNINIRTTELTFDNSRCSHPLYNSQTTHTHPPPPAHNRR